MGVGGKLEDERGKELYCETFEATWIYLELQSKRVGLSRMTHVLTKREQHQPG